MYPFLDRDGVINQDSPDYIKGRSEFDFIAGSVEAIRDLTRGGFTNIVITNQSAVPRKMISPQELEQVHSRMKDIIESNGGRIDDIFICPHLPSDGCACRKPLPGLIHQAQIKYDIDLAAKVKIPLPFSGGLMLSYKCPVLRYLVEKDMQGLLNFARDLGYQDLSEGYVSKCHLCLDIRKFLVSKGDYDDLRPKEFYAQLKSEPF